MLYKIGTDIVFYNTGLDFTALRGQLESGAVTGYDLDGVAMSPVNAISDLFLFSDHKPGSTLREQLQSNVALAPTILALIQTDLKDLPPNKREAIVEAMEPATRQMQMGAFDMASVFIGGMSTGTFFTVDRKTLYVGMLQSASASPFTASGYTPPSVAVLDYTTSDVVYSEVVGSTGAFQQILQNTLSGPLSSTDLIVSNDLGTDTTYYGDLGINSSGYTGSGSLSKPNATYLYAANGDLVLGTSTANNVHVVVNNGATDAIAVDGTSGDTVFTAKVTAVAMQATGPFLDSQGSTGEQGQVLAKDATGGQVWTSSGSGVSNLFISSTAPTGTPSQYMWVQTGMGVNGTGITFWLEDGKA